MVAAKEMPTNFSVCMVMAECEFHAGVQVLSPQPTPVGHTRLVPFDFFGDHYTQPTQQVFHPSSLLGCQFGQAGLCGGLFL